MAAVHPRRRVAHIPHRLVAGAVGVDGAAGAGVAGHADARTLPLEVRKVGERAGHPEKVDVALGARDAELVGPGVHAADPDLVDEIVVDRPAVRDLPVRRVLLEHAVAGLDHVPRRRVLVGRPRVSNEHAAHPRQILVTAQRELVLDLRERPDGFVVALGHRCVRRGEPVVAEREPREPRKARLRDRVVGERLPGHWIDFIPITDDGILRLDVFGMDQPAFSEQHHPAVARFSRLAQLAIRNNWYPARHDGRARRLPGRATFSRRSRSFTLRGTRTWPSSDGCSSAIPAPATRTRRPGSITRRRRPCVHAGHEELAGVAQLADPEHRRQPVPHGHVEARADQHGNPPPQADVDFLDVTGVFTNVPDDQRECPSIAMNGMRGRAAPSTPTPPSNQPMWDISNTTTWVKGSHTLNFGFNYRRWWLQREVGDGVPRQLHVQMSASPATVSPTCCWGTTPASACSSRRRSACQAPRATRREFNFQYFAPYFQDDWRVSSKLTVNLGLAGDYRNVPYETNNRMAWRNLDFGPGGLLVADESLVDGGIVDGAYYQDAGRRSPENPDRFKAFAPRFGFAWRPIGEQTVIRGGYGVFFDSAEGPRDRRLRRRLSVRQPRQLRAVGRPAHTAGDVGHAVPQLRSAGCGHTRGQHLPGGQPVAAAEEPLRAAVVARRPARGVPPNQYGDQLHRHARFQPADAAQHRAGPAHHDAANPQPVTARKPFPNFGTYIDSDWSGRSNYNALNTKLEHRLRQRDPDVRVHVGEEHRLEVGRRRHRRQRVQRMAGLPEQP